MSKYDNVITEKNIIKHKMHNYKCWPLENTVDCSMKWNLYNLKSYNKLEKKFKNNRIQYHYQLFNLFLTTNTKKNKMCFKWDHRI